MPTRPIRGLAEQYAALEATLSGTPLGRWFLSEYMRRHRMPETQLMLDAIARLERAMLKPKHQAGLTSVLGELVKISAAISRARAEIAQLRPADVDAELSNATEELDQIVETTEKATSEILSAAEDIQEVAWTLRENGVSPELGDRLDKHAIDIYTACSFQDITGQRVAKVVRTLRLIEQRINAVIDIWGAHDIAHKMSPPVEAGLLNGPQGEGAGLRQDDVDRALSQPEKGPDAAPAQAPEPAPEPHMRPEATRGEAPAGEARGGERFERPEPLVVPQLHRVKRAALFG